MGANATGVAMRVKTCPDVPARRGRSWLRPAPRETALAILATAVLTLVASGLASTLWSGHLSSQNIAVANAIGRLDLVASLATHEARAVFGPDGPNAAHLSAIADALPPIALSQGRVAHLSDANGFIVGSLPAAGRGPKSLFDLFGDGLARFDEHGGVHETSLRDGTGVIATVRGLGSGHLTVVQPRSAIVADAAGSLHGQLALALVGAVGLAGLGYGCLRYRGHARAAGLTCTRLTARLDTSLTQGRCGLFDWDCARRHVFWSASMYGLLGYQARGEYLLAGEVDAILRPEQGSLRGLMEEIAAAPGSDRHHDIRGRTAGGQWIWLRIRAELVRDPVDGSRHVVGFATDVTDERGQSERRATADIRLRDAVEAISEAFVLWDADRRLVLCNSKFLKLYELPPELASPGTPYEQVLAAARRPLVEKVLPGTSLSDTGARTIQTELPDGRWLHINERPTKDGGIVSVGTDISALKRSETKLRERERRLQGSVREAESEKHRLAVLAERNIEASQAKTEFLARMSHELRTPLNAILGFAEMMRAEILGPLGCGRYVEYTRDIHASGLQLLGVIDGILQMSRIERGEIQLSPGLMTIDTAVERAFEAVEGDARAKGLRVVTDIAEPALLLADGAALHEIFLQLLRNAIKFTRPGGSLRIRVRSAVTRLNIFVEDDGVGIPADVLPGLGRPFEQVEAEYSRAGTGAGLGLAIARALTEMHGGRLSIRSQLGCGTIVLVALPVVQPAANDPGEEACSAPVHMVAAE